MQLDHSKIQIFLIDDVPVNTEILWGYMKGIFEDKGIFLPQVLQLNCSFAAEKLYKAMGTTWAVKLVVTDVEDKAQRRFFPSKDAVEKSRDLGFTLAVISGNGPAMRDRYAGNNGGTLPAGVIFLDKPFTQDKIKEVLKAAGMVA